MSELVATVTVGARLRHDGETFQVVDFTGRRITLQSAGGRERQVEIGWLLGHPSTEFLGADAGDLQQPGRDRPDQHGQFGLELVGLGLQQLDALGGGPQRPHRGLVLQRPGRPRPQAGAIVDLAAGGLAAQLGP